MNTWINKNFGILLLLLAPFVVLPFLWEQIPDEVPIHWNAKGEIDNYAPKMPGMLILPLTAILTQVSFWVIPLIDPKKRTHEFAKTISIFQLITAFLLLGFFLIILMASLGQLEDPSFYILPVVLLSFAFFGNFFGRLRPNYFIGVRTPWTLESEDNWRKTHRLAGKIWVFVPIVLLVAYLLVNDEFVNLILIIGMGLMTVIPVGYSYWIFHMSKKSEA